jgi:prophage regulatory protein
MATQSQPVPTILRRKQVEARTGLKRTAIFDRIKAGTFPKPITLGNPLAIGWIESEVDDWIRSCIQKRGAGC